MGFGTQLIALGGLATPGAPRGVWSIATWLAPAMRAEHGGDPAPLRSPAESCVGPGSLQQGDGIGEFRKTVTDLTAD